MFGYCLFLEETKHSMGGKVGTQKKHYSGVLKGWTWLDSVSAYYNETATMKFNYIYSLNFTFLQRQQINLHNTFCVCLNICKVKYGGWGCEATVTTFGLIYPVSYLVYSAIPAVLNSYSLFSTSSISFFTLFELYLCGYWHRLMSNLFKILKISFAKNIQYNSCLELIDKSKALIWSHLSKWCKN